MHLEENQVFQGMARATSPAPKKDYLARAQDKRAEQASRIPAAWVLSPVPSVDDVPDTLAFIRSSGLLTDEELAITETTDVAGLLEKLATRQLTSVQVVGAFSKRAAIAHQLTTCCTEMFFEEALEGAKRLDEHLERTGETVGPLHGLPVSVKDSVDIKGQDTSLGESLRR